MLLLGGGSKPTEEQLSYAVSAMDDDGLAVQVAFEDGYVIVEIPEVPDDADLVGATKRVTRISWLAVPGDYKGVCIEATNVARTCRDADNLRENYGEAGSAR